MRTCTCRPREGTVSFVFRKMLIKFVIFSAQFLLIARSKSTQTTTMNSQLILKQLCQTSADCAVSGSVCDSSIQKCVCARDYVAVGTVRVHNNGRPATTIPLPYCLSIARISDKCYSDEQCIGEFSVCRNESQNDLYCQCRDGFHSIDEEEKITVSGRLVSNAPICRESTKKEPKILVNFALICLSIVILLIGCFCAIKWRQKQTPLVTSLPMQQQQHHVTNAPLMMGSVEAEFQNDFIEVFPMHHLQPLPDKTTSYRSMIM